MTNEEFDKLEPGDLVRGALSGMGFILAERIPHGFIGVRRQQITNPDEWKLIQKGEGVNPSDPEALRARLTATEAALTAARDLIDVSCMDTLRNFIGNDACMYCNTDLTLSEKHTQDCLYEKRSETFTAAVFRLDNMKTTP